MGWWAAVWQQLHPLAMVRTAATTCWCGGSWSANACRRCTCLAASLACTDDNAGVAGHCRMAAALHVAGREQGFEFEGLPQQC
ncbi:hypothetical protein COO60DRAFT_1587785 [Scenedesmus sp. NREL 46B-D3]|nr:hypothetical protein COO60DRAFT_1587785 [Scenedesmus sp. NREL 46B-D3]